MASVISNGCYRSSFNILVSLPDGRELCLQKELDEEAADPILARYQEILEVIARSVWFVVHVSVSPIKADISG
jgi:hypothetical protein